MQSVRELLAYGDVESSFLREMRSERAKESFSSLSFLSGTELEEERTVMLEAAEAARIIDLPIEVSFDLRGELERLEKGGRLSVDELYRFLVEANGRERVVASFSSGELPNNGVVLLARGLPELLPLRNALEKAIADDVSIKDKASPALYAIRRALRGLDGEMKEALNAELNAKAVYLSSPLPSIRDGKSVLAVKTAYRSKVPGAILATSASGETIFVEPLPLLRLEEKKRRLESEEKEEIEKILAFLSDFAASYARPLSEVNEKIARLDFLFAKIRWMNRFRGSIPEVRGSSLLLKGAVHPLLGGKAVPNDFELSEERPILVISGPNAGGKTVALKTVGLLSYMARLGLPITAMEGSRVPLYSAIGADIGDQQSIEESLSTFSGHLLGVESALEMASSTSLLLLDELGTGTSPREGEAIAYGVISYLLEKGSQAVVSSHFEGIKALAVSGGKVRNASMAYDEERGMATYRLRMDVPGESYGLFLARRYLPEAALEKAEDYLSGQVADSLEGALASLGEATARLEKREEELAREIGEFREKEAALAVEREKARKKEVEATRLLKEGKKELLESYEAKMKKIISSLSPSGKLHEAIAAKKEIEDLFEGEKEEKEPLDGEAPEVGDYCEVPSLSLEGRLEAAGKYLCIRAGSGALFKVAPGLARKIDPPKEGRPPLSGRFLDENSLRESLPLELNLIGMRAAEAESSLDEYVDRAILRGYGRVRIIHGFGGGTLRRVVREYAESHPDRVKRLEAAGEKEGMGGATIYYLK